MSLNVKPRKFSVEEYALMGEAGVFRPDERVELIEGEVIPVSPQDRKHALRIAKLNSLRTHDGSGTRPCPRIYPLNRELLPLQSRRSK